MAEKNIRRKELRAEVRRAQRLYADYADGRPSLADILDAPRIADMLDARAALDGLQPFDRIKLDG